MSTLIHRLTSNDLSAMRALNTLFAEVFEEPETYTGKPPDDVYLAATLARADVIALTATRDSAVVGGLVAYVLPKLEQGRSEIYIYDLAVAQSVRRQGIARVLITEVQAIAAEVGGWVVYVQADHGDDPAIALYTSCGTREDVLHFDLPPRPRL